MPAMISTIPPILTALIPSPPAKKPSRLLVEIAILLISVATPWSSSETSSRAGGWALLCPANPHTTPSPCARGPDVVSHVYVNPFPPFVAQTVADLPLALEAIDRDAYSMVQSLDLEVPGDRDDAHARVKTQSEGCERAVARGLVGNRVVGRGRDLEGMFVWKWQGRGFTRRRRGTHERARREERCGRHEASPANELDTPRDGPYVEQPFGHGGPPFRARSLTRSAVRRSAPFGSESFAESARVSPASSPSRTNCAEPSMANLSPTPD